MVHVLLLIIYLAFITQNKLAGCYSSDVSEHILIKLKNIAFVYIYKKDEISILSLTTIN